MNYRLIIILILLPLSLLAQVEKKVVVITGSSKSLGLEMAKKYQAENYHVVFASRSAPEEKYLKNGMGTFIKLDLTNSDDVKNFIPALQEKFSSVDLFIHNAAFTKGESAYKNAANTLEQTTKVNFLSPTELTGDYLRMMENYGKPGKVIYISSIGAILPRENFSGYSASKSASEAYFTALKDELSKTGKAHQVSIVRPALIKSEYTPNLQGSAKDVEAAAALRSMSPTTPETVVNKVFKVSQSSKMPTLVNVGIDGKVLSTMNKILPAKLFRSLSSLAEHAALAIKDVNQCSRHFTNMLSTRQAKYLKKLKKLAFLSAGGYLFLQTKLGEDAARSIDFAIDFWQNMKERAGEINKSVSDVLKKVKPRSSYWANNISSTKSDCSISLSGDMTMEGNMEDFIHHWHHALKIGLGSNHDALYADLIEDFYHQTKDNMVLKNLKMRVEDKVEVVMKDGLMIEMNEYIKVYQMGIKVSEQTRKYQKNNMSENVINPFEDTLNYYDCDSKNVTNFYNETYQSKHLGPDAEINTIFDLKEVQVENFQSPLNSNKEFQHQVEFFGL